MAYKKHHWATFLNSVEDEKLQEFVSFLYESRELDTKSRYSAVKYLLKLGYNVLYNDSLVSMMDKLYKMKVISKKKLEDTFQYALLVAKDIIDKEFEIFKEDGDN